MVFIIFKFLKMILRKFKPSKYFGVILKFSKKKKSIDFEIHK